MNATQIGIRELKSRLSHYLRRVKAGETLIITERGKPVGRIVPVEIPLGERLAHMVQAGTAEWNGQRLQPYRPKAVNRGAGQLSDLVVEARE
jgi:prevent-host-death family protein